MAAFTLLFMMATALLQQHVARCSQNVVQYNYQNGDLMDCEENGELYRIQQEMPTDDECMTCYCGSDSTKQCDDKRESCNNKLRCVDQVYDENTCCSYCPNGENCRLNGRIVSACGQIYQEASRFCRSWCECPPDLESYDSNTEAECHTVCMGLLDG